MNEEDKRETKEIITPIDKHKVVLKSYITGREKREMKNVYFEGVEFELEGAKPKTNKMDMGKMTDKAENKAIEMVVVSVNGKMEVINTILDMKSKDTDFVIAEINKITKDDDFLDESQKPKDITEPTN